MPSVFGTKVSRALANQPLALAPLDEHVQALDRRVEVERLHSFRRFSIAPFGVIKPTT
jgi:hypothetical protein